MTLLCLTTANASPLCSNLFSEIPVANSINISINQLAQDQAVANRFFNWSLLDKHFSRIRFEIAAITFPGINQNHFDRLLKESKDLVESNLGFQVQFADSYRKQRTTIKILDPEGKTISYGEYRMFDGGLRLNIFYIFTSPDFHKNNLSRLVLAKMLAENPRTQRIKTSFAETNKTIYEDAIANGDSVHEAILKTPAFKIRAQLGFSKIKMTDFESSGNLVVDKD